MGQCLVTLCEPFAREQAERAGRELQQGIDRGPLHGVPVGIKNIIDVAGVPTTHASCAVPPKMPDHSTAPVRHLETAGAVFVAKTNVLEFASRSLHPAFGQTNNPWDITRISGGSTRGPASYCSIARLRPSFDFVDTTGVYPLSPSLDHAGRWRARRCVRWPCWTR